MFPKEDKQCSNYRWAGNQEPHMWNHIARFTSNPPQNNKIAHARSQWIQGPNHQQQQPNIFKNRTHGSLKMSKYKKSRQLIESDLKTRFIRLYIPVMQKLFPG